MEKDKPNNLTKNIATEILEDGEFSDVSFAYTEPFRRVSKRLLDSTKSLAAVPNRFKLLISSLLLLSSIDAFVFQLFQNKPTEARSDRESMLFSKNADAEISEFPLISASRKFTKEAEISPIAGSEQMQTTDDDVKSHSIVRKSIKLSIEKQLVVQIIRIVSANKEKSTKSSGKGV
jgi:hypothetical protein